MKVAIPAWGNRVSPVLDTAGRLLVVEVADGRECGRSLHVVGGGEDALTLFQRHEVDTVICCAISRQLEMAAHGAGIRVIPHFCGPVEEILAAFLSGRLATAGFRAPGCRHRSPARSCGPGRRTPQRRERCARRDMGQPLASERKRKR